MRKEDIYADFANLFIGLKTAYGVLPIENKEAPQEEGEKFSVSPFIKKEPLKFSHYAEHLNGKKSLAVIPITEEGSVSFCALDVDEYPINVNAYIELITKYSMPLMPCRTKSGGLHLYMFFKQATPAPKALAALDQLRIVLNLPPSTEHFPKQTHLTEQGLGTVLNIPYFNAENTTRYAWGAEGHPLSLEEFVLQAKDKQISLEQFKKWYQAFPFSSAPPCLQKLYLSGKIGCGGYGRNTFLFSAATYLKARFGLDALESHLGRLNDTLPQPLEITEVQKIVTSHTKNTYGYKCDEGCFAENCDKDECRTREYGRGSANVSDFSFEGLQQVKTNPPYYIWIVSGAKMVFMNETELRKQDKFMDYCFRYLHKLPNRLKEQAWYNVLNTALSHIETVIPAPEEDLGEDSMFSSAITDFLFNRAHAKVKEQVALGQVYFDKLSGYVFRPDDLIEHLKKNGAITGASTKMLHYKLKLMGGTASRLYINTLKKQIRVWCLPPDLIDMTPVDSPEVAISRAERGTKYTEEDQLREAARAIQEEIDSAPDAPFDVVDEYGEDEEF